MQIVAVHYTRRTSFAAVARGGGYGQSLTAAWRRASAVLILHRHRDRGQQVSLIDRQGAAHHRRETQQN